MCKHVAAVLYGVGARLDEKPELFFTLRGVDMQELITAASATATAPLAPVATEGAALAGADLTEIFGVEIESATTAVPTGAPQSNPDPVRPAGKRSARLNRARVKPKAAKRKAGAKRR